MNRHESNKLNGRRVGSIQGPKNAESGWMRKIQKIGAPLGGHVAGFMNVKTGHIHRIRTPESARRGGLICGALHVESGHIFRLGHIRWHTNRSVFNDKCEFCRKEKAGLA